MEEKIVFKIKGNYTPKIDLVAEQKRIDFLEQEYQAKIKEIADEISKAAFIINNDTAKKSQLQKELVQKAFQWFKKNYQYENEILNHRTESGFNPFEILPYNYKDREVRCDEKYAPVLCGKGICSSVSDAFKDVCDLLKIHCSVISTRDEVVPADSFFKKYAHAWNEVILDNGGRYTVDLTPHFETCLGAVRTKLHNETEQ